MAPLPPTISLIPLAHASPPSPPPCTDLAPLSTSAPDPSPPFSRESVSCQLLSHQMKRWNSLLLPHAGRFAHETNNQSPVASDKNDITSTVSAADSKSSTQLSMPPIFFCPICFCWRMKPGSILWCTPKEPSMIRICL